MAVNGKLAGKRKVPLNSNQVKSLQTGVHTAGKARSGRMQARRAGVGAPLHRPPGEGGDRDRASGDVPSLTSARDDKVTLRRHCVDPRVGAGTIEGGKPFIAFAEEPYPTTRKRRLAKTAS
jgi:hypothetical protein